MTLCDLPGEETPDEILPAGQAEARASERYPDQSLVGPPGTGTLREVFTQSAQRRFRRVLNVLDPRVLAKLDQPFGKDNLSQFFVSVPSLRHVLLPLWKSGMLAGDDTAWLNFSRAYYPVATLRDLLEEYGDVNFMGVRGYPPTWDTETEVNTERVSMATAALLHFNGSVADLVRWIGGPHVAEHRDHDDTMRLLEESEVDPRVLADLRRILLDGIPALCQATSTEENFRAFYDYGNHSTVDDDPLKTYQATVKDNRKGYTLLFDPRVVLLTLHCHLTPQGVVDVNSLHKKPRPIFDSSFRPYPWCFAINDWTSKSNEPPLTFSTAELGFMVWLYNLRITYPECEIYIGDDDVSGAFRAMKYHPNCVAMHTSMQCGYCVVNTGGTFGDNTSPSNFDPIGLARRQLAWYLWKYRAEAVVEEVAKYLPPLQMADAPTRDEVASFARADADGINTGVLSPTGERLAPTYNMHVDDNLYADVGLFLSRTVCASVAALFHILGFPTDPLVPSALSGDKFEAWYNHLRKLVGRRFNSRTLTVGLVQYKRDLLLVLLTEWSTKETFDLLEICQLLGVLENHTKFARWARCWYFALQNAVRRALHTRYQILQRRFNQAGREKSLTRVLPGQLLDRLHSLIAREKAQVIWSTRQRFKVDPLMRGSIGHLRTYVADTVDPWEVPLGMIIPREPHFSSRGDASERGGGAYCLGLRFWFDLSWSPQTIRGIRDVSPSAPGYVHINSLEFIVVILQLAAIKTRLGTITLEDILTMFPTGLPAIPVWYGETDNSVSKSWENKATAKTSQGQGLVSIYAELLRSTNVHTMCDHLAGILNIIADDISRNDFSLGSVARCTQLFRKHPSLGSLDYFQPSPEFLQLLSSQLYCKHMQVPCVLPKVLGQFVPAGCTTFGTVTV